MCRYVLKIQLPPTYPFAAPDFLIMTPNGRFKTNTRLCMTFSSYHPETWTPSYTLTTLLISFISFFSEEKSNAIGVLHTSLQEKKRHAKDSVAWNRQHMYGKSNYSDMLKIFSFLKPGLQTEASIKAAMALRYPNQQKPAKSLSSAAAVAQPAVETPDSGFQILESVPLQAPAAQAPDVLQANHVGPAVRQPLVPAQQLACSTTGSELHTSAQTRQAEQFRKLDCSVIVLDDDEGGPELKHRRVAAPSSNCVDLT
jgi:hypothetical protein